MSNVFSFTFVSRYVLGGGALCMELLTKQVNTDSFLWIITKHV